MSGRKYTCADEEALRAELDPPQDDPPGPRLTARPQYEVLLYGKRGNLLDPVISLLPGEDRRWFEWLKPQRVKRVEVRLVDEPASSPGPATQS